MSINLIQRKTALSSGLLQLAEQIPFTYFLTLNTHRDGPMDAALKQLKRWRVEVLRLLHGRKFHTLPFDRRLTYVGCPELSAAGHPHFHLLVYVPPSARRSIEDVAHKRWTSIVPSGTTHLSTIGPTPRDRRHVMGYAAKRLNPDLPVPFVDSRADW